MIMSPTCLTDAGIPLMMAETFPRLEGGVRSVLEEVDQTE